MVEGVISPLFAPPSSKMRFLFAIPVSPGLAPPAGRFVMNKFGSRGKHRSPAPFAKAQAEIDVVEINGKVLFVKPADCLKFHAVNRKACTGYRQQGMIGTQPTEAPTILCLHGIEP
jgi:hypothetical protein